MLSNFLNLLNLLFWRVPKENTLGAKIGKCCLTSLIMLLRPSKLGFWRVVTKENRKGKKEGGGGGGGGGD